MSIFHTNSGVITIKPEEQAITNIELLFKGEKITQEKIEKAWGIFNATDWSKTRDRLGCSMNTYTREKHKSNALCIIKKAQQAFNKAQQASKKTEQARNEELGIETYDPMKGMFKPVPKEVFMAEAKKRARSGSALSDDLDGISERKSSLSSSLGSPNFLGDC